MANRQFRAYAFDDVLGGHMIDTSTCKGDQWIDVINKLNKLENVKADMETGLVSMKKNDIWCVLCAGEVSFADFTGEFIVDYEKKRIGVIVNGEVKYMIHEGGALQNSFTLKKEEIKNINTVEYLGIMDETTDQYVEFPPIVYLVDYIYFNGDCNKIAMGDLFKQNPHIKSFQNLHMICDNLVFINDQSVRVADGLVYIGDKPGYSFFSNMEEERGMLINNEEEIALCSIYKYMVFADKTVGQVTYKGYIIPEDEKYMSNIFEFRGIWLGLVNINFEQLAPFKPTSGQKTKAAR